MIRKMLEAIESQRNVYHALQTIDEIIKYLTPSI